MAAKNGDWETNRKLVLEGLDNIKILFTKVNAMDKRVAYVCGVATAINLAVGIAVVLLVASFRGG